MPRVEVRREKKRVRVVVAHRPFVGDEEGLVTSGRHGRKR